MTRSRITKLVAISSLLVGAFVVLGSGCVEAEGRFFADSFCPPVGSDADCEELLVTEYDVSTFCISGTCDAVTLPGTPTIRVVNRMVSSLEYEGNFNNVETSDILITGYDVRLNVGGSEQEFSYNKSGLVPVDGTLTFGFQLIPLGDAGNDLLSEVDSANEPVAGWAGVRVYGRTTGGLDVETPEAFIPVNFNTQ